jgi:hypothetical protein
MRIKAHGFDWDEGNRAKCQKHGLSLAEIEWVLRHGRLRVTDDDKHSLGEKRLIAIGRTQAGRFVLVGFTLRKRRGDRFIRPITARYMHVGRCVAMSSKIPEFRTDEELEAFLEQDLSDYITPENFKSARFEFLPKTRQVNLRFSEALLDAVRERAREQGISYQRYIRQAVERALDDRR